jgi:hypothetical protein
MKSSIGSTAALTAVVLACAAGNASAAPVVVDLRVEGAEETLFEGTVRTDGHAIEQDRNGPQPCDGTNAGANPTAGPTITSALDDAVSWNGSWNASFSDFIITRIGPDKATDTQFWGTALNGTPTEAGGCQVQVKEGDDVLWAYDMFSARQFLELTGPRTARVGRSFRVRVTDAKNGDAPVKGARVGGAKTDARGYARLEADERGTAVLKAERRRALRSNTLLVRVR